MNLIYSEHAVERMSSRGISVDVVRKTILNPLGKISQSQDKVIFYANIKNRKDNMIAVVVVNLTEVLTVMNFFEVKK